MCANIVEEVPKLGGKSKISTVLERICIMHISKNRNINYTDSLKQRIHNVSIAVWTISNESQSDPDSRLVSEHLAHIKIEI